MTSNTRASMLSLGRSLVTGRMVLKPAVKLRPVALTGLDLPPGAVGVKAPAKKAAAKKGALKSAASKKAAVKKAGLKRTPVK